ncbi:hypothetical protein GCM10023232_06870 [Sphingosinicella ginsenosidimutans]|uniref:HNH endonuclease n=1 Tax=Allosphingosinicella ginsenosidimutans TaxID=1176539 RepID=A0A5C6TVW6_9SPHN|nr:HNH endonuclease [Sphingosinicella ginsenosidimutans]TXC64522.1 HNH endonuclease [Sphingosinicella ginsenosidimutans]
MGKKFKGKTCVYCGTEGAAQTGDHVFAREFLPVAYRANLPKVPACAPCNGAKSALEHYLSAILPFGGRHPQSPAILAADVPRRLDRNARLHRELAHGKRDGWVSENGLIRPSMALPFEGEKLADLFVLITRGLAHHHFGVMIPQSYFVGAGLLVRRAESVLEGLIALNANARVLESLGGGLIEYEGAQAVNDPFLTIWRYRLYGGVVLTDLANPNEAPSTIWASSSRSRSQSVLTIDDDDRALSGPLGS